jgi:predicted alpha/beta superfamily hydrolase
MNRFLAALVYVLVAHAASVSAQAPPARVSLPRTERYDFASKVNGQAYRVYVSLPQAYVHEPAARYPVIYLTDANWVFGITVQTQVLLRIGGVMPEAMVVGIIRANVDEGNAESRLAAAERVPDLTPTRVENEEARFRKEYARDEVRTGGAPEFLRIFREELIPEIERRYRTNGNRTYVGYSLGGLFGAYALFHASDLFQRMILVSPSLWWDGNIATRYEEAYAEKHKSLPVRLFMSDGELETANMLSSMRGLASALTRRKYEGLQLHTRIFEGESHMTTFPVALTRGLTTVFAQSDEPSRR